MPAHGDQRKRQERHGGVLMAPLRTPPCPPHQLLPDWSPHHPVRRRGDALHARVCCACVCLMHGPCYRMPWLQAGRTTLCWGRTTTSSRRTASFSPRCNALPNSRKQARPNPCRCHLTSRRLPRGSTFRDCCVVHSTCTWVVGVVCGVCVLDGDE